MKVRALTSLAAAGLISLAAPLGANAGTLVVDDDLAECPQADFTTIQAAVTAAEPGSQILVCAGTYHESVTISKNDLRLLARGKPGEVVVDADQAFAGFQLLGASGVLIQGFTVRDAHEADIFGSNADGNRLRKNVLTGSGHDGIQLRAGSSDNIVEHNLSIDNPSSIACGIQVLDAGSTGNVVRHNVVINNAFGVQIAGGATDNVVFHNLAVNNRRVGVRNISANGTLIEGNRVFDTVGAGAPPDEGWGIGVVGTSLGVTVVRNHAFGNTVDLFTNAPPPANTFENNHCNTSVPPGLCEHEGGQSQ
jgi:nitrous oxidase accessory protein NosD